MFPLLLGTTLNFVSKGHQADIAEENWDICQLTPGTGEASPGLDPAGQAAPRGQLRPQHPPSSGAVADETAPHAS